VRKRTLWRCNVTTVPYSRDACIQFSSQYASVCVCKLSCHGKHINVPRGTFHHSDVCGVPSISFPYDHSSLTLRPHNLVGKPKYIIFKARKIMLLKWEVWGGIQFHWAFFIRKIKIKRKLPVDIWCRVYDVQKLQWNLICFVKNSSQRSPFFSPLLSYILYWILEMLWFVTLHIATLV
jgi:hypothetical protein